MKGHFHDQQVLKCCGWYVTNA